MVKKILFIFLFIPIVSSAQKVLASGGDYFSNANGSIEFTVGEIAIETLTSGTNFVTQGFHQNVLTVASVDDINNNLIVNAYPNPTSGILKLDIAEFYGLTYRVYDLKGRLLSNKSIQTKITEVDLSSVASGIYLITLNNSNNKKLKSYRIIKN